MIRAALLGAALLLGGPAFGQKAAPAPVEAVLDANGFEGFAMVASSKEIVWQTPRAECGRPSGDEVLLCHPRPTEFLRWPWASVSKQILAILTMQQVDAGRIRLDQTADVYLPALKGSTPAPTIRQLLQHQSGLRNPDQSSPDANGVPSFYTTGETGLGWCLAGRVAPGGDWRYNNCDSILLGAVLERVTGRSLPILFNTGIVKPLGLKGVGYVGQQEAGLPEFATNLPSGYAATLARMGAAAGLAGTGSDLLKIDRALLAGKLISPAARAEMWAGDPKLGFMGLGQWAFEAPLKGCAKPVRIIERRGAVGTYQVRNILLPEQDRIVILFTAQEKLDFGEIWQGKGLSHDLLAAAACS
jgi:CubicO group peptidase (beta-lactamase class C family)